MKFALYESDKKKWPHGTSTTCLHCGSAVRVNEPAIAARSTVLGTLAFHYDCLQELAELRPTVDRHADIQARIAETGGDPFGFKERNGF